MGADLVERFGLYLQSNRFVRGALSVAFALTLAVVSSYFGCVRAVTESALERATTLNVSYGDQVPTQLKREPAGSRFDFPVICADAKAVSPDSPAACSGVATVAFSKDGVTFSIIVVLGLIFLTAFSVLLGIFSTKPRSLVRGTSLELLVVCDESELTTNRLTYRGVKCIEKGTSPKVPVDLDFFLPTKKDCSDVVRITDLQIGTTNGTPVDLSPKFVETPFYKGHVSASDGGLGPLDFVLTYTITKNFALSAVALQSRWDDELAQQLKDNLTWSSRGNWASVTIQMNMPRALIDAIDANPWVTVKKADGAQDKPFKPTRRQTWNSGTWTLSLKDVGPGQSYTIWWKFKTPRSSKQSEVQVPAKPA